MAVCLVTGGAGFIGSHLVEALVGRGHAVRVLDNFSTGVIENLDQVETCIRLYRGTVANLDLVREATRGAEYVFHLAGTTAGVQSQADSVMAHHVEETGTLNALIAAWEAGVKRLVYASSSQVYGKCTGLPREEDEPAQPVCAHGVAKLMGEQQCLAFTEFYGLDTVRLRFFNVFGPRQPLASPVTTALVQMVRQMLGGCQPLVSPGKTGDRDLLQVDDAVYAILLAATTPRVAGQVYNIARGRPTLPAELVNCWNAILGTRLEPLETYVGTGEEIHHLADVRKAEGDLGFCPAMSLEEGLRRCVDFFVLRREQGGPHFSKFGPGMASAGRTER